MRSLRAAVVAAARRERGASPAPRVQRRAAPAATSPVDRVLVVSLPAVSWADVESADAPHLKALLAQSAVADLVTRAAGRRNSAASGYATLGAGGRASAVNPLAGQAFEPSEPYGATTAGEVFRQRTGLTVDGGLVHLGIDALDQENAEGVYDPTLGAFGDALTRAHVSRAVVANADGAQPVIDDGIAPYQRSAVSALMDHDGVVPDGSVGDELLVRDPAAPFGLRLDADAVFAAFQSAWQSRSVVLVEALRPPPRRSLRRVHHSRPAPCAQGARAARHRRTRRTDARQTSTSRVMRWWSSVLRRRGTDRDSPSPRFARRTCRPVCCGRRRAVAPGLSMSPTSRRPCSTCSASVRPTTWKGA